MNEDRKKVLHMLNICKGQIEGISKMIEDDMESKINELSNIIEKAINVK